MLRHPHNLFGAHPHLVMIYLHLTIQNHPLLRGLLVFEILFIVYFWLISWIRIYILTHEICFEEKLYKMMVFM
jgi:hypothetical protein